MLITRQTGLLFFSLIVAVFVYWGGLSEAVFRWSIQEEYSHGFLIPLVTLYILWEKRMLIQASIGPPLWSGAVIVLLALVVFIVGEISALFILIQYSFVFLLIGLSLATIGKATKYTYVPILLLLFAIPLPYVIEVVLTAKLQLISSWLGVSFIRLCNIPVFLEGNVIDLGVYKLQVVEACSGLRYLFPLMSLGFITAYFYHAPFWKRVIVFLATIPITIFMNSFRIGAIGVMVDNWGISMAEGFLHDFEGWIIFMACAAILFLLVLVLEKITSKHNSLGEAFGVVAVPDSSLQNKFDSNNVTNKPLLFVITILSVSFVLTQFLDKREEQLPGHVSFVNFPMSLGDWSGQHDKLEKRVVTKLGMTDYVLANYRNDKEQVVNLYVAYYESQRKGVSPHSPRVCIPGGGWEIADLQRITAGGHPVNRVVIQKGNQKNLVYYWFQGHGRIVANEYLNKWYLLLDAVFKNRTDGALVRVVTGVTSNEEMGEADARLLRFMKKAEPELKLFILD